MFEEQEMRSKSKFAWVLIATLATLSIATSLIVYFLYTDDTIYINDGRIFLNSTELPLGSEIEEIKEILGEPSRVLGEDQNLFVWDERGLRAYTYGNKIFSIDFDIREQNRQGDFAPLRKFGGALRIDGIDVQSESTIRWINEQRRGTSFKHDISSRYFAVFPNTRIDLQTTSDSLDSSIETISVVDKKLLKEELKRRGVDADINRSLNEQLAERLTKKILK